MKDGVRDVKADYIAAHVEEYNNAMAVGLRREAAKMAAHLRDYYGHDVGHIEAAVADESDTETAVRRGPGRPRKDAQA